MHSEAELERLLRGIDGRGYKAYKELQRGRYELNGCQLFVDHVQGDPFAAPSRMRLRVPMQTARIPSDLFSNRVRRVAFEDFVARAVARAIRHETRGGRGSGKSGRVEIDAGGQEVLERTAASVCSEFIEARLEVGLPAAGRRVLGREAEELLLDELPAIARTALRMETLGEEDARRQLECAEDHAALQRELDTHGLVAFVADSAILPRESGASDHPPQKNAVPFRAPDALRLTVCLPFAGEVGGLGIPKGVTLIVGGGYHGKSTLLRALERGVHPHVPGDGREQVATRATAVKIRAEEGRRVTGCDIHAFIDDLPQGLGPTRSTRAFESDDASGSTSQAANIVEAIEAGSDLLLLDEDTSAANFMVRDARMQALVHPDHEPITPFVDRVRELYDVLGVSSVLVMGGSGDYFDVADTVIEMRDYLPRDVTAEAKHIAAQHRDGMRQREAKAGIEPPRHRVPDRRSLDPSRGRRDVKVDARGKDALLFGTSEIDLRSVEQLVDPSQTRAIAQILVRAREEWMGPEITFANLLDRIETSLDEEGLDPFSDRPMNLARPRRFEVAAALNRLRTLRVEPAR
ncbi:MAG: ABC-ATPase domain-containing protein [bacterium]|nr:ABC-ATPase domain-containing protein [bacterium]